MGRRTSRRAVKRHFTLGDKLCVSPYDLSCRRHLSVTKEGTGVRLCVLQHSYATPPPDFLDSPVPGTPIGSHRPGREVQFLHCLISFFDLATRTLVSSSALLDTPGLKTRPCRTRISRAPGLFFVEFSSMCCLLFDSSKGHGTDSRGGYCLRSTCGQRRWELKALVLFVLARVGEWDSKIYFSGVSFLLLFRALLF